MVSRGPPRAGPGRSRPCGSERTGAGVGARSVRSRHSGADPKAFAHAGSGDCFRIGQVDAAQRRTAVGCGGRGLRCVAHHRHQAPVSAEPRKSRCRHRRARKSTVASHQARHRSRSDSRRYRYAWQLHRGRDPMNAPNPAFELTSTSGAPRAGLRYFPSHGAPLVPTAQLLH